MSSAEGNRTLHIGVKNQSIEKVYNNNYMKNLLSKRITIALRKNKSGCLQWAEQIKCYGARGLFTGEVKYLTAVSTTCFGRRQILVSRYYKGISHIKSTLLQIQEKLFWYLSLVRCLRKVSLRTITIIFHLLQFNW